MSGTRTIRAHRALFSRVAVGLAVAVAGTTLAIADTVQPASAAERTVCETGSLARQRTEIDADIPVEQFDPSLGTLLEVNVTHQTIKLDTDSYYENTTQSQMFAELMQYSATFTNPAGLPAPGPLTGSFQRVPPTRFGAFDGTLDFLGLSSYTQPATTQSDSTGAASSRDPGVLATFSGSGVANFHLTTLITEIFTGGGGNMAALINTFASADVEVCYLYSVPDDPPPTTTPTTAPPIQILGISLPALPIIALPRIAL